MKAQLGRRYSIIQNGRCHQKFDITTLPEWHDGLDVVDITDLSPEPDEGDLFDGSVFSKPVVVAPPAPTPRLNLDDLADLLVTKGLVTRGEVDGRKR